MRHVFASLFVFSALALAVSATAAPPAVGARAMEIEIEEFVQGPEDAASVSLESLAGNVIVLEFWATWCGPCVAAIPDLNELADRFADDNVRFISITDEPRETIELFLKQKQMKSWVALDTDGSMFSAYRVTGIPHTVIIDREGNIAAYTIPMQVTAKTIEDVLANRDPNVRPTAFQRPTRSDRESNDAPNPLFEVTIRPAKHAAGTTSSGPSMIEFDGQPLLAVMSRAYEITESRIVADAPLPSELLYVKAQLSRHDRDRILPFLRSALEMTFEYTTRFEEREVDVYVITTHGERGKNLTEAFEDSGSFSQWSNQSLAATNYSVQSFGDMLEENLRHPVVDETQLEGGWNFALKWKGSGEQAIQAAMREQLGLDIVPAKRTLRVLVVEKTADEAR